MNSQAKLYRSGHILHVWYRKSKRERENEANLFIVGGVAVLLLRCIELLGSTFSL